MKRSEFLKNMIGVFGVSQIPVEFATKLQKIYLLQCFVRGFKFYGGLKILDQVKEFDVLELVREPENKYDKNAIAIYYNKLKIGFVPAEENDILCVLMDANLIPLRAEVTRIEPQAATWENVHIGIYTFKEKENNKNLSNFEMIETPDYYSFHLKKYDK